MTALLWHLMALTYEHGISKAQGHQEYCFKTALVLYPLALSARQSKQGFIQTLHYYSHHTLKFAFPKFNVIGTKRVSIKYWEFGVKGMKACRRCNSLQTFKCDYSSQAMLYADPHQLTTTVRDKSVTCPRHRYTLTSLCHVSSIKKWIQREASFD